MSINIQHELAVIDQLCKNQYFYACLEQLQDLQNSLESKIVNPEELDQDILMGLYGIYERQSGILNDLNQAQQAVQILYKMAKLEEQIAQILPKNKIQRMANIYAKIGKSCFQCCQYEMTVGFLQTAEISLRDNQLTQTAEYALTLAQLGNYYRFMFKDDLAEHCLKESLAIRNDIFSRSSIEVADSLYGLAQLYSDEGQIDNAIEAIKEAILIQTVKFGVNHIKTAKSIYLHGNLYLRLKPNKENLQKAEDLVMQSLEINLQVMGERFQETADCYHSLGKIKSQNYKSDEYTEYFQKSLNILQDIYGNQHACIAILLNNFGRAYYERRKFDQAVSCFQQSIVIYHRICGDHHGNLAITLKSCADCHKEMGRFKQAQIDYEKSLHIYQQIDSNYNSTIVAIQQQLKDITDNHIED